MIVRYEDIERKRALNEFFRLCYSAKERSESFDEWMAQIDAEAEQARIEYERRVPADSPRDVSVLWDCFTKIAHD
jgi:hypothetical protein